jgi:ankyrin repeat protein
MAAIFLLIAWLLFGNCVAVDISDFSNDLASDLGPLLSLFGDSMTKQFLSESITFLDYIIFATAPIGIITALVSAIRLCGSTSLRAFIGRSQEGQGTVEAELCTSTSRDVCELFTRGGIQRVLGRPSILELVYLPRTTKLKNPSGGLSTIDSQLLLSREYFTKHARALDTPWKEIKSSNSGRKTLDSTPTLAPNPNLSLNVGIRRSPDWVLWMVASIGIILQAGVLALAGVGVWILGWDLSEGGGPAARDYAPIMFIAGTILMCAGMWGCAFLIGQTTQEIRFQRKDNKKAEPRPRLLWLQPGPQVIGDQSFDPFAYLEGENTVQVWSSSRKRLDKRFELYTYIAVLATLVGYIVQFIGIRGMEAWISLSQLAVTILMSILRGSLRMKRLGNNDNQLREMPDMVAGHELDWLAFQLASNDSQLKSSWHVTAQHEKGIECEQSPSSHSDGTSASPSIILTSTPAIASSHISAATKSDSRIESTSLHAVDSSHDNVLHIRMRLANLTGLPPFIKADDEQHQVWKDEHVKVRAKARQLSLAFSTTLLSRNTTRRAKDIELRIRTTTLRGKDTREQPISLTLKAPPEFSQVGWRLDAATLEAVLGLWLWTMYSDERVVLSNRDLQDYADHVPKYSKADGVQTARIVSFGPDDTSWANDTDIQGEMDLWLGRSAVKFRQSTMSIRRQQPYGLSTLFYDGPKDSKDDWEVLQVGQKIIYAFDNLQRFCGWSSAYPAIADGLKQSATASSTSGPNSSSHAAPRFRVQYSQLASTNTSLLDFCCQELFIGLMMSLIDFEDTPIENPTFEETGNSLRLVHPVVSIFTDAFVEGGLGTHSDALLCIIPALRRKMPALNLEVVLPGLIETADKYRHESQWERAQTVLQFGCARSEQHGVPPMYLEQTIRALCELYRWSLSKFSEAERTFGMNSITDIAKAYAKAYKSNTNLERIMDCYKEIARRFEDGSADKARVVRNKRTINNKSELARWQELQHRLLQAIELENRTEALYQLSVITPECEHYDSIPASALALAVRNNWAEVASALLELNANPNDADKDGKRGIYHCAELGHDACAALLLKYHVSLDTTLSSEGSRLMLLHTAARHGHSGVVQLLLDNGFVEKDQKNDENLTPLMVAAIEDRTEVVRILVNTPGLTVERNIFSRTPLSCAAEKGHHDVIKLLLDSGNVLIDHQDELGRTPLWLAVANEDMETALLLIKRGANLDVKDSNGRTPLAHAANNRHLDIVRGLLDKGANVDTQDEEQMTPLMQTASNLWTLHDLPYYLTAQEASASARVCEEIFCSLVERATNLEIKDRHGLSVLARVTKHDKGLLTDCLLARNADVNSKDKEGRTPLMYALECENPIVAFKLLDAGADIHMRDEWGQTAFFYAQRDASLVNLLLNKGVDIETQNKYGETPLWYGIRRWPPKRHADLYRGADGQLESKDGMSTLVLRDKEAWLEKYYLYR